MSKLSYPGRRAGAQPALPAVAAFDQRDIDAVTYRNPFRRWGGFPTPGRSRKNSSAALPKCRAEATRADGQRHGQHEVALRGLTWAGATSAGAGADLPGHGGGAMAAGAIRLSWTWTLKITAWTPRRPRPPSPHAPRLFCGAPGGPDGDMDAIHGNRERHNLVVVEDCAHAHGAKWRGRGAGTLGILGLSRCNVQNPDHGEGACYCAAPRNWPTAPPA